MPKRENRMIYIRWAILAVIIVIVSLFQNTRGLLPEIYGVRAMPLIPLVVCIGMFERDWGSAALGLFAGLLWDGVSAHGQGFRSIYLMIIGCVCGLLLHYFMRRNLITALLLTSVALIVHNLLYWVFFLLIPGYDGAVSLLLEFYLPSCLYSLIFMPLFFAIMKSLHKRFPNPIVTNG